MIQKKCVFFFHVIIIKSMLNVLCAMSFSTSSAINSITAGANSTKL